MSIFYEIAYAATNNRLCLFTGTGFSKSVTKNLAPTWKGLLESVCDLLDDPVAFKELLFTDEDKNQLNLEEIAQILAIELQKKGLSIHEETAKIIKKISLAGDNEQIRKFMVERSFRVLTTNYDKLVEKIIGEDECHSITPGLPIPRSKERVKVFHIHGSIDSPENMVITSDDYFKFLHGESYFSRKLSTILHENTIVILGYALGDTNLKSILSDYRGFSKNHIIGSNIILISRLEVEQHIKDYYSHCYGIRVIDNLEVEDFFESLNIQIPDAEDRAKRALINIKQVVLNGKTFTEKHLAIENSFFEIISSIGAVGLSINDPRVVKTLGSIIDVKTDLTNEHNAWAQYSHLANWLVYLGSILEISGTSIEDLYLASVKRSMEAMRKELYIGYSWQAYKSWSRGWDGITANNRILIKNHIEEKSNWPDALFVVNK